MSIPTSRLPNRDDVLSSLPPIRPRPLKPPMDVAAIYARAGQPPDIERQFDRCEAYALDRGLDLRESFHDISGGASIEGRPGLGAMLDAARDGRFGVLIADDFDRLIRDMAIAGGIFAWMERHGIEIHTPGRGRLRRADVLLGGLLGDEGRRIMAERVRHALRRMVLDGLSPHAPCHGYARVPGRPGEFAVKPRQAEQVEQAFRMRSEGMSLGRIATVLGNPLPDGRPWTRNGISRLLRNPLYAGVLVHGRTRRTTDPLTGRPIVVACPTHEWSVCLVAHLRIVEPSVWHAVQATFRGPGASGIVPGTWPDAGGSPAPAAAASGRAVAPAVTGDGRTSVARASVNAAAPCRQGS